MQSRFRILFIKEICQQQTFREELVIINQNWNLASGENFQEPFGFVWQINEHCVMPTQNAIKTIIKTDPRIGNRMVDYSHYALGIQYQLDPLRIRTESHRVEAQWTWHLWRFHGIWKTSVKHLVKFNKRNVTSHHTYLWTSVWWPWLFHKNV